MELCFTLESQPESIFRLRWKISVLIKEGLVLGSQVCFDVFHAKLALNCFQSCRPML